MEEKNERIAIITDSCSDVPEEWKKQYPIFILPIVISCQDGEYRDGVDITAQDVYEKLKTEVPKTSTPTGEDIVNLLTEVKKQGYHKAIAIMISSGISSTINHLRLAVEEDKELEVCIIDSLLSSIGTGAVAIQTAMWEEEGVPYSELCGKAVDLCKKTNVYFSVDTLEYLQKGGRIGKITAMVGSALNIKPILSFDAEGELCMSTKVRGHKLVEKKLISIVEEHIKNSGAKKYNILVADGGAPEEGDALEAKVRELFPDYEHLFRSKLGATLSVYIGDGILGAGIQFLE